MLSWSQVDSAGPENSVGTSLLWQSGGEDKTERLSFSNLKFKTRNLEFPGPRTEGYCWDQIYSKFLLKAEIHLNSSLGSPGSPVSFPGSEKTVSHPWLSALSCAQLLLPACLDCFSSHTQSVTLLCHAHPSLPVYTLHNTPNTLSAHMHAHVCTHTERERNREKERRDLYTV